MKYSSLYLCLSLVIACNIQANENDVKARFILKKVFENPFLQLEVKDLSFIKDLLIRTENASPEQLNAVAQKVKENLNKQINQLNQEIEQKKQQKQPIPFTTWRTINLLIEQKNHMAELESKFPRAPLFTRVLTWLGFIDRQEQKDTEKLTEDILAFITIERERILFSYSKTMGYLGTQKYLPKIIRFWDERTHRFRLLQDVKQMTPQAEVQGFIVDLLLQTAIFMGESVYEGWVSKADLDYYNSLAEQEKKMQADYAEFRQTLQAKQKTNINNIINNFKTESKTLEQERTNSQTLFSNEVTYLNKLYDQSPPKENYLYQGKIIDAIGFDQAFETSPMYTPDNDHPWYNIYPQPNQILAAAASAGIPVVAVTDWQYDSKADQFFQYNLVPFQTPQSIQDQVKANLPPNYLPDTGQFAHNNAIFTEYITGARSYQIDIDCTLIGASYPFFMGIIFNKARWISGVVERIEQYRLLGLYGTQDEKGNKKGVIGFAEYKYTPPADEKGKPVITPPMNQIIDPKYQPLATLDPKIVDNLGKNPITFSMDILVEPTVITLTISTVDSEGNKNIIVSNQSISGLSPLLYLYHGIGFMAPGCQASFKINKPQALTYTNIQKINFEKMIDEALKK